MKAIPLKVLNLAFGKISMTDKVFFVICNLGSKDFQYVVK